MSEKCILKCTLKTQTLTEGGKKKELGRQDLVKRSEIIWGGGGGLGSGQLDESKWKQTEVVFAQTMN